MTPRQQDSYYLTLTLHQINVSMASIQGAVQEAQIRAMQVDRLYPPGTPNDFQPNNSFIPLLTDQQAMHLELLQENLIFLRNLAIRFDAFSGFSGRDIAKKYKVSPGRISQVMNSPLEVPTKIVETFTLSQAYGVIPNM